MADATSGVPQPVTGERQIRSLQRTIAALLIHNGGMRRVLIRWATALVALACGWMFGFVVYIMIAAASPADMQAWAAWTAMFCLAAWFLIGLPLAIQGPDLSSTGRIAIATLLCGLAGALMICCFFRTMAALFSFFSLLAFLTAAASMLVYAALLRSLQRS